MTPNASKSLDEKTFDYKMFKKELVEECRKRGTTMDKVSVEVLIRSHAYLSNAISTKKLPLNIALAMVKWMGVDIKRYEIKKKPVEKKPKEKPVAEVTENAALEEKTEQPDEKGWACQIRVDEEFGTAMMKITKDGKEIALGRSYLFGKDETGIIQSISYAAHMCYKISQQSKIADESVKVNDLEVVPECVNEPDAEEDDPPQMQGRLIFKDWIKKYENDNSKAGKLARYVKSQYKFFPATGKKKLRMYIRLNNGDTHLSTFDAMWDMYVKWFDTEYAANNRNLANSA